MTAEDAFLVANWRLYSVREIGKMMGRGGAYVVHRAQELGLPDRRKINLAARKEHERVARRRAVTAAPAAELNAPQVWPDGWAIRPPTKQELMARR